MPQIPSYMKGLTSNRLRSLLNYLNGVSGILQVKYPTAQPGLKFQAKVCDHMTQAEHMDALTWAMAQSEWAGTVVAPDTMDLSATCSHYGPLVGRAKLTPNEDGTWTWDFKLAATGPVPLSWMA